MVSPPQKTMTLKTSFLVRNISYLIFPLVVCPICNLDKTPFKSPTFALVKACSLMATHCTPTPWTGLLRLRMKCLVWNCFDIWFLQVTDADKFTWGFNSEKFSALSPLLEYQLSLYLKCKLVGTNPFRIFQLKPNWGNCLDTWGSSTARSLPNDSLLNSNTCSIETA